MKKALPLLAILIAGILIGKFVLNNTSTSSKDETKQAEKEAHWTCSMHPEIDLPEFGACPKCGMDLIPKAVDSEGLASNEFKMSKNALALANIETLKIGDDTKLSSKKNTNKLSLSGKIKVNDKATAMQTAHFGGRIESLKYRSIGEYVKKGSLIASIYSPELVTAQNEFLEALNIKKSQPELYNAVRNKLRNWKISETQIQQIEQTKKVITNFNMYANVSGYIDEILVQNGNHVSEGTPLFKVSNLGTVWATFDVYENDIKYLKIGQKIKIKASAYPNKIMDARINFIDPNLNQATRTIAVRATLPNSKTKLKPGMLLTSEVQLSKETSKASNSVEVPKTAVLWTGKRSVVYVKTSKEEPVFELREVTLGKAKGLKYQVIEGLENGEEIVVNGIFTVDAAAQLQGKSSMMNKKGKSENKDEKNEKIKVERKERIAVNPKFKKQLNVIVHNYLKIKNALVISDAKKVAYNSEMMLLELKKVKMSLLKKPKAHKVWMPAIKTIKAALQKLKKEEDIEKQRTEFINLSNVMITVVQIFGIEKEVYVEHCPMANDNKGANWLSFDKAIKNPYFGDKMLQCGTVEQIIE